MQQVRLFVKESFALPSLDAWSVPPTTSSSARRSDAQMRFSQPGKTTTFVSVAYKTWSSFSQGIFKFRVPMCVATATPDTPWTLMPINGCASVSKLTSFTIDTSAQVSKPKKPLSSDFDVESEMAYAVAKTQNRFFEERESSERKG